MVTGAAGFIGSNLIDRLLADGHQVIGVDNLSTGTMANLEPAFSVNMPGKQRFIFLENDIQAPDLAGLVAGCHPDVIFHLAAQVNPQTAMDDPQFDARCNVLGTINLCEASRQSGVRRVVYAGSSASTRGVLDDAALTYPASPGAAAKLAGEMYLHAYGEMYGLAPICLALSNVYGPRQSSYGPAGAVVHLGGGEIAGQPWTRCWNDAAKQDFIYVDDVVDAFVRAGGAAIETTGTYNIGTGRHTSFAELADLMSTIRNGGPAPSWYPGIAELRPGAAYVTRAQSDLGWTPTFDLAAGLDRTIRWLSATLALDLPYLIGA
ncbi:NAD-dependent epimerase/dehydratase family protein [Mycobacterium sp. URHB0044]|uniref:NAD-dependent epimerase/dehydratase family protein n=1 Tax=Mycobacterium sp. URHB0044 TaxID=1380386 RepID=UPI000AA856FA